MKFHAFRVLALKRVNVPTAALVLLMPAFCSAASIGAEAGPLGAAAYKPGGKPTAASRLIKMRANLSAPVPQPKVRKEPASPRQLANKRFAKLIDEASRSASLEPALVHAVIAIESGYNPAARSVKGAIGLMQVMPATAARYGVANPAISPQENLRAGTRYLRYLMELFDNRIELVLAAYNAGEFAVLRHGYRIPPYRETQNYVPAVLARYHELRAQEPPPVAASVPIVSGIQYMPGTTPEPGAVDKLMYRLGEESRPVRDY